jgi:hypothetical protein
MAEEKNKISLYTLVKKELLSPFTDDKWYFNLQTTFLIQTSV